MWGHVVTTRHVCSLIYLVAEIIPVSVSLGDYDHICVKRNAVNICTDPEEGWKRGKTSSLRDVIEFASLPEENGECVYTDNVVFGLLKVLFHLVCCGEQFGVY